MRIVKFVVLGLLVLMSLAASVAKIMQMPQEVAFFVSVDIPLAMLVPFGLVQLLGAVMAVIPKTRKTGLMIMATVFLASAIMIFMGGDIRFGLISLIPSALAAGLAVTNWRKA